MKRTFILLIFMLSLCPLFGHAQACVPGSGVNCTPNLGLWLPPYKYPAWNGPLNYNFTTIDTAIAAATGKPASPSFSVQFANTSAAAFQGDANFTFNPTTHTLFALNVTGNVNTTQNVMTFGAVSDALSDSNCTMASGSYTLNCAGGLFTAAAVGKVISVQYAGGTGNLNQPLTTTIATYISPTQVTLTAPATQTAFGTVSTATLTNIGTSGYTTAHYIPSTTSGSGVGAMLSIAATSGKINGAALLYNGAHGTSGYTTASGLPTTSSCGLTAAVASITASGGVITSGTVTGIGMTYPLGCLIYPTQSGSSGDAYFTVVSAAASVDEGGLGYAVGDKVYPTQSGSSGDAYLTVTAVTNTGAIWGTDDTVAFNTWMAALGLGKPGLIPNGQFIYNMAHGANTMTLSSNVDITMNRSGTVYMIGGAPNGPSGGWLFTIPEGTVNVHFNSLNIAGEFINHGNIYHGLGYGGGILVGDSAGTPTHGILIQNSVFTNLLSTPAFDDVNTDYNIDFINNIVQYAGEVNLNSSDTNVTGNHLIGTGGIESGGGTNFHVDNNILDNPVGAYEIEVGGATDGVPRTGGTARGNIIRNPLPGDSCLSLGDGFTQGIVSDNICTGVSQSAVGGGFGIINVYSGYTHTFNNIIAHNQISGYDSNSAVYIEGATGDKITGNTGAGVQNGLVLDNAQNIDSNGNTWAGSYGDDMIVEEGSTAHIKDILTFGNYSTAGSPASTITLDSHLYTPAGDELVGAPVYLTPPAFVGTSFNTTIGSPNPWPFSSGDGAYSVFVLKGSPGPANSIIDFGPANAGINTAHSAIAAEYDGIYSADLAFCAAFNGNSAYPPTDCVIGLRIYSNQNGTANVYGFSSFNGSICVGAAASCPDPGIGDIQYLGQLVGPTTAPSGTCTRVGWSFNGDGTATFCPFVSGTWEQPFAAPSLTGTTGTITGTSLSASCDSGTASVSGAVVGSPVAVSSTTGADVGGAFNVRGSVTSTGTVTVYVCGTGTPASLAYNVTVF